MANLNINGRSVDPRSVRQIPVPQGQKPAEYLKSNEGLIRKNFRDELYFEQNDQLYVTEDKFVIENLGLRKLDDIKLQMDAIPAIPLFLDNEADSHKVFDIKIEGAEENQSWLEDNLKIKAGRRVNLHDLQKEADRLFDSNRFLSIDFAPVATDDGIDLQLIVQPVPKTVTIAGQGVSQSTVNNLFTQPLTQKNIDAGIEKLKAHFKDHPQFLLQDIQAQVQGAELTIHVGHAEIPGRLHLSGDQKLQNVIPKPYTQANIDKGISKLRKHFHEQGQIIPELSVSVTGSELNIDYKATPMPKSLGITGSSIYPAEQLKKLMPQPMTMDNIEKGLQAIKDLYKQEGYVLVEPDSVAANLEAGKLDIQVKEAHLSQAVFTGNDKTETQILNREMRLQKGDVMNLKTLSEDMDRIRGTSSLGNVQHRLEIDPENPGQVKVHVHVSEEKSSALNVGAGYSISKGPFGTASLAMGNMQGKNRKFSADVSLGTKVIGGGVSYYDPWAFKGRTSLGASAYHRHWKGPFSDEDRTGAKVTIGKPLGDIHNSPWRMDLTLGAERIGIDDQYSVGQDGVDIRTSIRPTLTYSKLDDPVLPHKGNRFQLSLEPVLTDGNMLGKIDAQYEHHFDLGERFTLSAGLQGGSIMGDAPLYEKYNNAGNGRSLMGWESDGSLVGSNYALGSVSLRTEIWGPVSATAKVTAGDYFNKLDMSPKVGAGVGVNVKLGKFGVLHAGYGMKLLGKESGDKGGAFHIGFGIPF